MLLRFWRWLFTDVREPNYLEDALRDEIDYLRIELRLAHRRLYRIYRQSETSPLASSERTIKPSPDPIRLSGYKSVEMRRMELERKSKERNVPPMTEEAKRNLEYWSGKSKAEEESVFEELARIEDEISEGRSEGEGINDPRHAHDFASR